jgi:hypothetical protein
VTALMESLFPVAGAEVALTTDEWYTPRWLFGAAGLTFDLDVCAPIDPAFRTCPARRHLTVLDDGLQQEWAGTVWMNPPYSKAAPWVDRFAAHPDGLGLLLGVPRKWLGPMMRAADAFTILTLVEFGRPTGNMRGDLKWPCFLIARGAACVAALSRVADADLYVQGAYHVRPGGRA